MNLLTNKKPIKLPFNRLLFASVCLFAVAFWACETDDETSIPYAAVNFEIVPRLASESTLTGNNYLGSLSASGMAGECVVCPDDLDPKWGRFGFGGVIVYGSMSGYVAFDRACPYEAQSDIKIVPDGRGFADCPSCGSRFCLADGTGNKQSGPTKYSLVRYKVYLGNVPGKTIVKVTN